jgi:hypothetical protein
MNSPADRRAQYDHVLGEVDADLGIVLDAFAAAGDRAPIIAVTADHGEALGDHGQPYHSTDLYDSQIHVPLVIRPPWRRRWQSFATLAAGAIRRWPRRNGFEPSGSRGPSGVRRSSTSAWPPIDPEHPFPALLR